jgi:16S rRNA (uracil1498-N3)-methyltransferase
MATQRRLFVLRPQDPAAEAGSVPLSDDEQHYARHVLRLGDGDAITLADGSGHLAPGVLRLGPGKTCTAELTGPFQRALGLTQAPKLVLACPMPKGERADWMAEKVAELGVETWVWVVCDRSVVLPKGAAKPERLLRLMRAAARQARHGRIPKLLGPMPLARHLEEVQAGPPSSRFVADAEGIRAAQALSAAHSAVRHLLVGPEGGLTPDELRAAQAAGYGRLTLGPHILRVETAAIACAVLMGQTDG